MRAPFHTLTLLAWMVIALPALAQAPSGSSFATLPSPTIPSAQPTTLPPPEPSSTQELDAALAKLATGDEAARKAALADLAEGDAAQLPAIAVKLSTLRKSADRDGIGRILTATTRKKGNKADDDDKGRKDDDGAKPGAERVLIDPSGEDWLGQVLAHGDRDKQAYKDAVAVLALERACVCIGTTAAAREIINVYTYFGDLFRIDVQRQLSRMGERSLPALIEAKYHDSRMVRTWAERRLDSLGKVIPSEAVRTGDNQVLADVLRAYGRAREVEAVRVIVSYANSDRLQVREAARESIGMIGEPARWQLREAYENLTGKKPDNSWDWKRVATELFATYDRARLSEVYKLADDGFTSFKAGKLDDAIAAFDKVLARAPTFERRAEMVPAYVDYAKALHDKNRAAARAALRRAELLDPSGPLAKSIQSEQLLIEAEELRAQGMLDLTLLRRAVELDPSNVRAKGELEKAELDLEVRQNSWRRYAAAVAIGLIAMGAMIFIALAPRRPKKQEAQADKDPPTPPPHEGPQPEEK